jgi:hypothetical protein
MLATIAGVYLIELLELNLFILFSKLDLFVEMKQIKFIFIKWSSLQNDTKIVL